MIEATLRFRGGPLDGEVKRQTVPDSWDVLRYERPANPTNTVRHVYAGCRQPRCSTIVMAYIGTVEEREVTTADA